MTYEELKKLIVSGNTDDVICKQFCVFPNQIASFIESVGLGSQKYVFVFIGFVNVKINYRLCGFDKNMNMDNIVQNAMKQVRVNTEISYEICNVERRR